MRYPKSVSKIDLNAERLNEDRQLRLTALDKAFLIAQIDDDGSLEQIIANAIKLYKFLNADKLISF